MELTAAHVLAMAEREEGEDRPSGAPDNGGAGYA